MKFSIFTGEKNLYILHGHVFVMVSNQVLQKPGSTATERNFGFRKKRVCTIHGAKTEVLISCAVFAYADCWVSDAVAHYATPSPLAECFDQF